MSISLCEQFKAQCRKFLAHERINLLLVQRSAIPIEINLRIEKQIIRNHIASRSLFQKGPTKGFTLDKKPRQAKRRRRHEADLQRLRLMVEKLELQRI